MQEAATAGMLVKLEQKRSGVQLRKAGSVQIGCDCALGGPGSVHTSGEGQREREGRRDEEREGGRERERGRER